MLIRSSYPVRYPSTIPSDRLTRLIPRATLTDLLYPSFPFTVIDIDHAEGPPQWFSDLEPWYELFCPELWVYLERDEASSLALEASYEAYAQELEDLGEDSAEAMARLEEDSHEVTAERFNCWAAIYALHGLRKAFLEFHRSADAASGRLPRNNEAIVASESKRLSIPVPAPQAARGSVWPSSVPHPTSTSSITNVPPFSSHHLLSQCTLPPLHFAPAPAGFLRTPPQSPLKFGLRNRADGQGRIEVPYSSLCTATDV